MLCYAILFYVMLCFALQTAVSDLSFLAKPHQANEHDDQIALVDPHEAYKSDTPTTHRHPWHGPNHGPAHDHNHNYGLGHDNHDFSSPDPNLGPQHFMHLNYCSTTWQIGQVCQSSSIWQLIALHQN